MIKSQNTKNEQQNDLCITSEQLTEQWEKGELPSGWYYTKLWKGCIVIDYFIGNQFLRYDDSDIDEVIAPVPTFDEWQASEKYDKHLEEKIKIYERKDKQATETSIAYNELSDENTKIKELLKRARDLIEQMSWCESFYAYNDGLDEEIDEVLNGNTSKN